MEHIVDLFKFFLTWIGDHPMLFFLTSPFWFALVLLPLMFVWEVLAGIGNGILQLFRIVVRGK